MKNWTLCFLLLDSKTRPCVQACWPSVEQSHKAENNRWWCCKDCWLVVAKTSGIWPESYIICHYQNPPIWRTLITPMPLSLYLSTNDITQVFRVLRTSSKLCHVFKTLQCYLSLLALVTSLMDKKPISQVKCRSTRLQNWLLPFHETSLIMPLWAKRNINAVYNQMPLSWNRFNTVVLLDLLLRQIRGVVTNVELGIGCATPDIREQTRSRKIGSRPVVSSRKNSEFEIPQSGEVQFYCKLAEECNACLSLCAKTAIYFIVL